MTETRERLAAVRTGVMEDPATVKTGIREGLAAVKTDIDEGMAAVQEDLTRIEGKIDSLSRDLEDHKSKTEASPLHGCGGTGGWRRVVYLDMTDPNTKCPSGWQLTSHPKRTCGKVNTSELSCDSVFFAVSGRHYTSVCGSIRAYQYSHTDAFEAYNNAAVATIEGAYVAGVSLTHGRPRQHIWTFAAAATETSTNAEGCPCNGASVAIPPFVGGDYFCESADTSGSPVGIFYPDDPLWDGDGCSNSSSCCSFNSPPYFTKQLPSSTSDLIEVRLCQWQAYDDSPVEFMELYIK